MTSSSSSNHNQNQNINNNTLTYWNFTRDWSVAFGLTAVRLLLRQPFDRMKLEITFFYKTFGRQFNGLSDLVRSVTRLRGPLIWWSNGLTAIALIGPVAATILALNDRFLALLPAYNARNEFVRSLGAKIAAGACAGAIGHGLMHPIQMANYNIAKAKAKAKVSASAASSSGFRHILQMMRGERLHFSCTVAAASLYRGAQLGVFYQLQELNPWARDRGFAGVSSTFLAAVAGHYVATPLSFPVITIMRRLSLDQSLELSRREYSGFADCLRTIVAKEGVKGLIRGMRPEFVFTAVGQSMVLMGYDRIKAYLDS